MAAKQGMCYSYKQDLFNGVHETGDTYKIALFNGASHDANTTAYSATNEVSGTGYTAGGATLSGRQVVVATSSSLSITGITRSGQTATATTAAANHGKQVGQVITVAGAGQSEYNITAVITSVPALNQFTYEVEGSPTTPATGTITYTYKDIILDWTTDPSWASSTITADSALIYNDTAAGKNALAVLKFATTSSTNGTFTVQLPAPTVDTGVIRLN
jgi:hypothetical protein